MRCVEQSADADSTGSLISLRVANAVVFFGTAELLLDTQPNPNPNGADLFRTNRTETPENFRTVEHYENLAAEVPFILFRITAAFS